MTDRSEDREQIQERRAARRQGLAYQGAFEAVIAILIATGIGYWIDTSFDTWPYGLLIGAAVASCFAPLTMTPSLVSSTT